MLAGSIANAKLTNSSITFGSTTQALGSTVSAISGVTIDNGAIGGTTPAAGTFTTLTAQNETLKGTGQNLIVNSQSVGASPWVQSGTATASINSATAPDSTTTASTISNATDILLGGNNLRQTVVASGNLTYTLSCYIKFNTATTVSFTARDSATGSFTTATTTTATNWTRISVVVTASASATSFALMLGNANGTFYAWGAQLELGSVLGTYIPTTTTAVYGTPTLSFSGVASIGLQSDGSLYETSAGTGNIRFYTNNIGQEQARVTHTANAVNYQTLTGSATTYAPVHSVAGSDASISMVLQPKNTGAIDLSAQGGVNISNGGTVTALTRTVNGTGYTSFPSIVISAPTTAGGVQATASNTYMQNLAATIQSGGTGYTVGDVLTMVGGTPQSAAGTFTVATVSSGVVTSVTNSSFQNYSVLPSNPISVTGGTGTGCTLNVTYIISGVFTITNAGSGYVEQPTVTFSGGGGSGAAAYASVGASPVVKGLFNTLEFWSSQGRQLTVGQTSATGTSSAQISNDSANRTIFGGSGQTILTSGGTNTVFIQTNSTSQNQFAVSHTASAVNYVQVTGAATGSNPTISAQGSDAGMNLNLVAKGGFSVVLQTRGGGTQRTAFLANDSGSNSVNYLQATSNNAGSAPYFSAAGTDTDIQLSLVPKGLGIVLMNQQTPTAVTATGTLTIANLLTQIITSTSAVAVALTLPTGTLSDAGVSGGTSAVNTSFDYSIINTGSAVGDVTMVAGTAHTIVGSVTVPVGTTGNFRCRKTATNTFVSYRV
jgi:hypothetical protein